LLEIYLFINIYYFSRILRKIEDFSIMPQPLFLAGQRKMTGGAGFRRRWRWKRKGRNIFKVFNIF